MIISDKIWIHETVQGINRHSIDWLTQILPVHPKLLRFDFVQCLQQDFKFYGIAVGADIDKETESITVD
jgi:hypothetical protein